MVALPIFAFLPVLSFGQATPALSSCFGKDFPAYEAVLGKASERNVDSLAEDRIYRGKHNGSVCLRKEKHAKVVTTLLVLYPKGNIGWRQALRTIGVRTDDARLTKKSGYFMISGCKGIPTGWMVWWQTNVDGTGQSELSLGVAHRIVYSSSSPARG